MRMLKALLKAFSFSVGVLMALPLLMMFAGVMMALVGSIAGATSVADIGKSLAGTGAIGFVIALYVGGKFAHSLNASNSSSKTQSDPSIFPGYRAQQVRRNPAEFGANVPPDDASKDRRKALSEELAKRRLSKTGKGEA